MSNPVLPTGTITFLFTDIEGSTKLWENHPDAMQAALVRHEVVLKSAIAAEGGAVFKMMGDAFCAAFANAPAALDAAANAQSALQNEAWPFETPLRVRMALHTGTVEERDNDYFGPVLNRVARLLAAGHGGQTLLSAATYELVRDRLPDGVTLQDLGAHRLKDLDRPEHIFQVILPGLLDAFAPLRTLDNTPNNLPQQVTSFIGRGKPLSDVQSLLTKTRLLTLTGAGGAGKTRLSLQVAADVLDAYPDGAWLIELAPLADPALVPQTVASALGVKEQAGQTLTQTLTGYLKAKNLLLVIDNCEHLIGACAQLVTALLRACPNVKVLATSREPLGIAGEQTYRVPSLSLPDPKAAKAATPENLSQFEAVRLFIERAQAVKPDFAVTNANAPALAQLCFHLDGIPLALELAAARVRSLAIEQINDKLDTRFRLLTGGDRSALPRQQTLRALVDWSYDLLSDTEKVIFARLSIFAGGWTLQAAESVCGFDPVEDWEVLDVLTSLADKSLILAEEAEGETRYAMLETLKQYGAEKLNAGGETADVRNRHLEYFVTFAEEVEPKLYVAEQLAWLNRLETEHDNMRAALGWCMPDKVERSLRLSGSLSQFWFVRGYFTEGRHHLTNALHSAKEANLPHSAVMEKAQAKALNGAGWLAINQGDYLTARNQFEESKILYQKISDQRGTGTSFVSLGHVAYHQSDYALAQSLYEKGLAVWREINYKPGIASVLGKLATIFYDQGDFLVAQANYEESVVFYKEVGDKTGLAPALGNLGNIACNRGDYVAGQFLYEESLAASRDIGNRQGIAYSHLCLGNISWYQGDYITAKGHYNESLVLFSELDDKRGIAFSLIELGRSANMHGDYNEALRLYTESLAIRYELKDARNIAYSLEGVGVVFLNNSEVRKAAIVWGAAALLRQNINLALFSEEQGEQDLQVDRARSFLGEEAFSVAWSEGRALSMEQAVDYALKQKAE